MSWTKEKNIRNAGHWLARAIELIELKDYQKRNGTVPTIYRGGVFNVELGEGNLGGEKNKRRPCLIISRNQLNSGDIVVLIPLTTKFKYNLVKGVKTPKYKNHYILLKSKYPFLNEDSCVKFEDIKTVDKVRIGEHLGNIDVKDLDLMRNRLLFAMGF